MRFVRALHTHTPCPACDEADMHIDHLKARIAEQDEQIRRLTATPELRRREWTFGEQP